MRNILAVLLLAATVSIYASEPKVVTVAAPPIAPAFGREQPCITWQNNIALVTPANGNSNTDLFINGTYAGTKISGGPNYTEAIHLGANPSGGGVIPDGDYAQLIVYNTVHTTDERQKVEGYLAHRLALTGSLPGSHPYVSTPPLP